MKELRQEYKKLENKIKAKNLEEETLVKKVAKRVLKDDNIIKKTQEEIKQSRDKLTTEIQQVVFKMNRINKKKLDMEEANIRRAELVDEYMHLDRLDEMTFDAKRELLFWLFNGKDPDGTPYGVYVTKRGLRKNIEVDYFMFGRLTGLRTLKGKDIDYYDPAWGSDKDAIARSDDKDELPVIKIKGVKKRTGGRSKRKPKYKPQDWVFDDWAKKGKNYKTINGQLIG